jgi:hypothetical protein
LILLLRLDRRSALGPRMDERTDLKKLMMYFTRMLNQNIAITLRAIEQRHTAVRRSFN